MALKVLQSDVPVVNSDHVHGEKTVESQHVLCNVKETLSSFPMAVLNYKFGMANRQY